MPTLVEIGPSNASQGQHRRKGATEQIKNLTLAGSIYVYIYMNIYMCISTRKCPRLISFYIIVTFYFHDYFMSIFSQRH